MPDIAVRYIVTDVDEATAFYTTWLGFTVAIDAAPAFMALDRGGLRLFLNAAGGPGGASQAMPDGSRPAPGGWNRFQLQIDDLDAEVDRMRAQGLHFRSDVIVGRGGSQILLDDPAGNPVELFQPAR